MWRNRFLILLSIFFASLIGFWGNCAFAEDEIILSISDDSAEMNLFQGQFGEES